ncbi:GNAT family N-acetyltransferase [Mycolicibacterium brisbanense]|uniref:GNAT family N-acetyltransferase n=1 Tax=Mycolicibacterium brisbanense TaxID=146020 RepID=UPI000A475CE4|nr:GNAT family N-acetyltransferase [Mycolicibacterium brisbanense]
MPAFSATVTDYWRSCFTGDVLYRDDDLTVVTNPGLEDDTPVMVLKPGDGGLRAVLTPELAELAALRGRTSLSESDFRGSLAAAGITLNGADYVFYFPPSAGHSLTEERPDVRRLTEHDSAVFAEFESAASERDRDDAYVELDHWAVFGAFEQNKLVCAASAYPWGDARIADLGVLTLPAFRGKGHARNVVRAISRYAFEQGYEPQYRCQLDNAGSVAVADALGLQAFGTWEALSPDCEIGFDSGQG